MSAVRKATLSIYRYTSRWLVIIVAIAAILLLSSFVLPFQIVGAALGFIALILTASLILERNSGLTRADADAPETRATDPFGNAGAISSTNSQTGLKFDH